MGCVRRETQTNLNIKYTTTLPATSRVFAVVWISLTRWAARQSVSAPRSFWLREIQTCSQTNGEKLNIPPADEEPKAERWGEGKVKYQVCEKENEREDKRSVERLREGKDEILDVWEGK